MTVSALFIDSDNQKREILISDKQVGLIRELEADLSETVGLSFLELLTYIYPHPNEQLVAYCFNDDLADMLQYREDIARY